MEAGSRGSGRRRLPRLAILASAACLALAYPVAVTAPATAATVTPGFDPYVGAGPTGYGYAGQMAGEVVRIHTAWCAISPMGAGLYNATAINGVRDRVHDAEAAGMKPLLNFGTGAPNGAKQGTAGCGYSPAIALGAAPLYGDAAKVLAQCLAMNGCPVSGVGSDGWGNLVNGSAPGMRGLELGNEPNSATFWCKGVSDGECNSSIVQQDANIYASAAKSAATKIQNNVPALKIGTAGLSYGNPDGNPWGGHAVDANDYLIQMLSVHQNGDLAVDAFSIHPYGPGLHPSFYPGCGAQCEEHVANDIGAARFIIFDAGYGTAANPIWITEVGIDADYNDNCGTDPGQQLPPDCYKNLIQGIPEQNLQANHLQYVWNTIRHECSSFNVPLAIFWSLVDAGNPNGRFFAGFMGSDFDESKPAFGYFSTPHPGLPQDGGGQAKPLTFNSCLG